MSSVLLKKEKKCKFCNKIYLTEKIPQVEGERDVEEDICPYCERSNGSSMSWSYNNSKQ